MSIETLEQWSSWTGFLAALLGGLVAALVLLAWFFSHQLSKAKGEAFERFRVETSERTAALEFETETQRERAALAERALLELHRKTLPRAIEPERMSALVAALREADPKDFVRIDFTIGREPTGLAQQIATALREAGWECELTSFQQIPSPPVGYAIVVKSEADIPPHGESLRGAFEKADIAISVVESTGLDANEVRIIVGVKEQ